jgi:1-deoxy-D-xylulose-5-phosphate reductoisomerase
MAAPAERLDLAAVARLDFERPDTGRFPALRIAREALEAGGSAPTVLNAANEIAVANFLEGRIGFADIARLVEESLGHRPAAAPASIDEVIALDRETRRSVSCLISESCA